MISLNSLCYSGFLLAPWLWFLQFSNGLALSSESLILAYLSLLQIVFYHDVFPDPLHMALHSLPSADLLSSFFPSPGLQKFCPILTSAQPLDNQHLLTRQWINGKNCLLKTGDSKLKRYNAMSLLKQDLRAEKLTFEQPKDILHTVHKVTLPTVRWVINQK